SPARPSRLDQYCRWPPRRHEDTKKHLLASCFRGFVADPSVPIHRRRSTRSSVARPRFGGWSIEGDRNRQSPGAGAKSGISAAFIADDDRDPRNMTVDADFTASSTAGTVVWHKSNQGTEGVTLLAYVVPQTLGNSLTSVRSKLTRCIPGCGGRAGA